MKKSVALALSVVGLFAALALFVSLGASLAQGQTAAAEGAGTPGRFQVVYIAAPGASTTNAKQTILLDTATGDSWAMRDWNRWQRLPVTGPVQE